jgi:hypothetical protein
VSGKRRVPKPAAGMTAFVILFKGTTFYYRLRKKSKEDKPDPKKNARLLRYLPES